MRNLCLILLIVAFPCIPVVADSPAARPTPAVQNPRMTAGRDAPEHWTDKYESSGKIAIFRDTETWHSTPAALRIETVEGPAKGQVSQFFEASPGTKVQLIGYLRADGGAKALLGIMAYRENWQAISFQPVGNALSGFDWRKAEGKVTLPDGTRHAAITCMIEGNGYVWLDDVSLDGTDLGADAQPQSKPLAEKPKPVGPRKPINSCDPAEGFYPDYPQAWQQVLEGQLKRAKEGPAAIVFLGDSLV